jgi:hypothetical protein
LSRDDGKNGTGYIPSDDRHQEKEQVVSEGTMDHEETSRNFFVTLLLDQPDGMHHHPPAQMSDDSF